MSSSETLYRGRILTLNREAHALPDGRVGSFEIVRHPGGAAVLPVHSDGRVTLIRQFRPAGGGLLLEIPAGRREPGEDPATCVQRELEEEAGLRAATLIPLGSTLATVGYSDEVIHLFAATDLTEVATNRDADEYIERCDCTLAEALALIDSGAIVDAKTQLTLLLYARYCSE